MQVTFKMEEKWSMARSAMNVNDFINRAKGAVHGLWNVGPKVGMSLLSKTLQ